MKINPIPGYPVKFVLGVILITLITSLSSLLIANLPVSLYIGASVLIAIAFIGALYMIGSKEFKRILNGGLLDV